MVISMVKNELIASTRRINLPGSLLSAAGIPGFGGMMAADYSRTSMTSFKMRAWNDNAIDIHGGGRLARGEWIPVGFEDGGRNAALRGNHFHRPVHPKLVDRGQVFGQRRGFADVHQHMPAGVNHKPVGTRRVGREHVASDLLPLRIAGLQNLPHSLHQRVEGVDASIMSAISPSTSCSSPTLT